MHTNLEEYLKACFSNGIIDFSIRTSIVNEKIRFYIHPLGVGYDTMDFEVTENELKYLGKNL